MEQMKKIWQMKYIKDFVKKYKILIIKRFELITLIWIFFVFIMNF